MKWIFLLMHGCALLVSALPVTAAYHCSPMTLRELPVMTDKPYLEVRRNLIALGWQPIPHGTSKFPEARSCSTQGFMRCDFIFNDPLTHTELVIVARNGMATGIKGNTHDFVVTEYQTLCSQ